MQQSTITTSDGAPAQLAILIEVKSVYGELKAYPACGRARCFADLAGTKTLTYAALKLIEQLGFVVVSTANADWSRVR